MEQDKSRKSTIVKSTGDFLYHPGRNIYVKKLALLRELKGQSSQCEHNIRDET